MTGQHFLSKTAIWTPTERQEGLAILTGGPLFPLEDVVHPINACYHHNIGQITTRLPTRA